MLNKYMFWLVIGFAVFIFWKIYSSRASNQLKRDQSNREKTRHVDSPSQSSASQKNLAQDVEPCAWCGVYMPRSEGFSHKGSSNTDPVWCCVEHLQLGAKPKSRWWRR